MREKIEARTSYTFPVAAEKVYDAWLEPASIRVWLSHSLKSHGLMGEIVRVDVDPKVGGQFFFSDRRGESIAEHWGRYLQLERPEKIAFTWIVDASQEEDPSIVTLSLHPTATGCEATIVHQMDAEWIEYVERTAEGWQRMLANIDQLLQP
ncbi:SRPBCC domain-containing protein [Bremerella sp. JC817]|uniref:SRPBCC family protein n=1 Tax=Bremerella sp. JC817 TaxID=3231756 RepID=UPI003458A467